MKKGSQPEMCAWGNCFILPHAWASLVHCAEWCLLPLKCILDCSHRSIFGFKYWNCYQGHCGNSASAHLLVYQAAVLAQPVRFSTCRAGVGVVVGFSRQADGPAFPFMVSLPHPFNLSQNPVRSWWLLVSSFLTESKIKVRLLKQKSSHLTFPCSMLLLRTEHLKTMRRYLTSAVARLTHLQAACASSSNSWWLIWEH